MSVRRIRSPSLPRWSLLPASKGHTRSGASVLYVYMLVCRRVVLLVCRRLLLALVSVRFGGGVSGESLSCFDYPHE